MISSGAHKDKGRKTASFPARFYLVALVLAVAAPSILVTGYLLMRYAEAERARLEEQVRDEARAIASALDRRFASMIEAVQVLALTQDLDRQGLEEFHARAARAKGILGRNIVLRDLDGQQIVNPRASQGQPLPRTLRQADIAVLATGRPQVSDVFESPLDKEKIVSLVIPVLRDGKIIYLLNLSQDLSYFEGLLSDVRMPAEHIGLIMDSNGVVVSRSPGRRAICGLAGRKRPTSARGRLAGRRCRWPAFADRLGDVGHQRVARHGERAPQGDRRAATARAQLDRHCRGRPSSCSDWRWRGASARESPVRCAR